MRVVRVGDRVRTGLDPRGLEPASEEFKGRCPELAEAFLEEVRAGWLLDFAIGVGVSGGLGKLSFRRVGVGVSGVGGEGEDVVRSSRVGLDGGEREG
jgi:hypothetical protein